MATTRMKTGVVTLLCAAVTVACSRPGANREHDATSPTRASATFVNRVWKVAESSSVAPGQLYVFLSEGTLVVASPHGKPALGSWSSKGDSLTMVEEGIAYGVEILELNEKAFRIKIHDPGEGVEIRFVPGEDSLATPDGR